MWTLINQVYSTPHGMNCWASLPNTGYRKVKPLSADGVSNTFLVLALARATGKQAYVVQDSANEITAAYL